MKNAAQETTAPLTVEEYIRFELEAERRHEYINGQLFEMPDEKDINNKVAGFIFAALSGQLYAKGVQIYINDVKAGLPEKTRYYYPDVFATKESPSGKNRYIKYEPELIVEVLSPSTYTTDTVDKYIAYTQIPSLNYYLLVEPETVYAVLHSKNAEGKWEAMTYTKSTDVISLPLLETELPLSEVYK